MLTALMIFNLVILLITTLIMILTAASSIFKGWRDSIDRNNNYANVPRNWLGCIDRNYMPPKKMKILKKQMIVILVFNFLVLFILSLLLK
jgi:hypothetical protein